MGDLLKEAQDIQSFLEITCSNNVDEIIDRIFTLNVYLARTGEMLATAKRLLRHRKTEEINKTIIAIAKASHLSASVQNALLDSICENESYVVDFIERINRVCVHQLDTLRSVLSYEKESIRLSNTGY